MEAEDFELYSAGSRRRFRFTVAALLVGLLAALFVPWALVPTRVLSSSAAEVITCFSAFLLVGVWRALLTKIGDPNDAAEPSEESRRAHLRSLLGVAGAVVALLLSFGGVF